jgi:hypothetical protein
VNTGLKELNVYDSTGKGYTLGQLAGENGLVIVAHRVDCPIVRKYSQRIEEIRQNLKKDKINLIYLNAIKGDTNEKIANYISEFKISTPIFTDRNMVSTNSLGLERSSEVVYLDQRMNVKYQGAIDDGQDYEATREARHDYLMEAIKSVQSGSSRIVPRTEARGCLI